jgi:hypothetical protein
LYALSLISKKSKIKLPQSILFGHGPVSRADRRWHLDFPAVLDEPIDVINYARPQPLYKYDQIWYRTQENLNEKECVGVVEWRPNSFQTKK